MIGGKGDEVSAVLEEMDFVPGTFRKAAVRAVRSGRMIRRVGEGKAELWVGASPRVVTVLLADEGSTWCFGWEGEAVEALRAALVME